MKTDNLLVKTTGEERNHQIDLIRITATLMIVLAHVVMTVYERPDWFGGKVWWLAFGTITFGRLGVPLFFMISGYLLANKRRSWQENIGHTGRRIGIPLLVWTGLTYWAQSYSGSQALTLNADLLWVAAGTPFYFLIGLAVLYMLNPLIQRLVAAARRNELRLALMILAISTVGQTIYANAKSLAGFSVFSYWFLALVYFLYGQYYKKFEREEKTNRGSGLLFWLPMGITLGLVYRLRAGGIWGNLVWESYFGPTIMPASLALFGGMMQMNMRNWSEKTKRGAAGLAKACFGVYLSHWLVADLLWHKTALNPFGGEAINLGFFLGASIGLTLLISWGVSVGLAQFRWGRIILGSSKT